MVKIFVSLLSGHASYIKFTKLQDRHHHKQVTNSWEQSLPQEVRSFSVS